MHLVAEQESQAGNRRVSYGLCIGCGAVTFLPSSASLSSSPRFPLLSPPACLYLELAELGDTLLGQVLDDVVWVILNQLLDSQRRVSVGAIFNGVPHRVGVCNQQGFLLWRLLCHAAVELLLLLLHRVEAQQGAGEWERVGESSEGDVACVRATAGRSSLCLQSA